MSVWACLQFSITTTVLLHHAHNILCCQELVILPFSRKPKNKCAFLHDVSMCLHISIHFSDYETSPQLLYTSIVFVLSHLIIQVDDQNKGRGYCGCMCAWVEAAWRRRCCREQKHFADVVGRRSEWKVLWLSVVQLSLTCKGMLHVAPSQLSLSFRFAKSDWVII